jgi:hypothetical protein
MRRAATISAAALLLVAGCTTPVLREPGQVAVTLEPEPEWLGLASSEDVDRLERAEEAWASALAGIGATRFARAVAREGELLEPEAALARPELPPGSYHCRLLRLSVGPGRRPAVAAFRPFFCHVADAGPLLAFTKQTGSERPSGYFYPDDRRDRLIFLGNMAVGAQAQLPYDGASSRDMVGLVERVGPFRWRLVLPWPRSGATLEVMELVPALP